MSTPNGPQDPYQPSGENPYGQQPPAYGQQPPAYGQQPPAYGQQGYPAAPSYPSAPGYYGNGTEQNSLGVWALVLGIAGFVCLGIFGWIPSIILGNKAKKAAAEGRANNPGLGTAGVVMGWIGVVLTVISVVVSAVIISSVGVDEFLRMVNLEASYNVG